MEITEEKQNIFKSFAVILPIKGQNYKEDTFGNFTLLWKINKKVNEH